VGRRFREHDKRTVTDLNGVWDFTFIGDVDPDSIDIANLRFIDRMAVPACFDATPAYAGKRGLAAYRTRIMLHDSTPHRLVFDSVHHWCRVFVDGVRKGEYSGGYTRFNVDLTGYEPGEVTVILLVDNRFDSTRNPLHYEYFDWYHYGGITRGVALHRLGDMWINWLDVTTQSISPPEIKVKIAYDAVTPPRSSTLTIIVDTDVVLSEDIALPTCPGEIERVFTLPGASLWSPAAPNLHTLYVQFAEDDIRERIGLRQVRVEGQQITINDQPIRLLGFNRHEAHPQFGCALPAAIRVADIQQLRDLGCNFVRGSHYPQDPHFLDLCDEAGLCVWSESIGWQHPADHITNPTFIQAQLTHIDEMLGTAANHASVIMWGILNESHSNDPACRPGYETLLHHIRHRDPTRPVTYASNHPFDDKCFDLADILSINCYPGWYGSEIESISDEIDQIIAHVDGNGTDTKPIIISEIGAGAIPGWRDWNGARWSEQYQAHLVETVIQYLFTERKRVCGLSLWQFCDCRISEAVQKILGRPRGFNNKGIVDEYRRPKLAYEVVKREFHALQANKK
jgi:beta-glucuronidase